ncbi:hypothetical protein DFJ63DRAFT_333761 [Scheffersomyces coipomensis]|uniref:uncharacterized protein n=1 Tax=Scheffersomyces coipomensis TaxID=1788519 RepID=UPI00315CFFB3
MAKFHKKHLNKIYGYPIPITTTSEAYGVSLPEVYPHNPISWLFFAYKLIQYNLSLTVPQSEIKFIEVELDQSSMFKVDQTDDVLRLWRRGFFGKGILSRSEPTWKERTINRLNLNSEGEGGSNLLMEDVTVKRREGRQKYKDERSKIQALELLQRKGEILSNDDLKLLDEYRENMAKLKNPNIRSNGDGDNDEEYIREEDEVLIDEDTNQLISNLEFLQLQSIEVFFLKFGLNVIKITHNQLKLSTRDLFLQCCQLQSSSTVIKPNNQFIFEYVVYHHYRSLGWCVRSGIKFGSDMLLYKRGPPFSHAEHAVMIIPNDESESESSQYDWFELASRARVIGTVKKNFVLTFVDYPHDIEDVNEIWSQVTDEDDDKEILSQFFKLYKITEILYRRWSPSRTRD